MRLLEDLGCSNAELSLVFCDDRTIATLNKKYRKLAKSTDVLSFALRENSCDQMINNVLGDVVISVETAKRQARARKLALRDELIRLLIHGCLHLVGYDHVGVSKAKATRMRKKEDKLWQILR